MRQKIIHCLARMYKTSIFSYGSVTLLCALSRRLVNMELCEEFLHSKLFWLTTILFGVYLYIKYIVYGYWARKGIPHDPPTILLGNVPLSYFRGEITHGTIVKESYDKHKKHRFHGLYLLYEPILVINDPDLIRLILVKNFANFFNRGTYYNEKNDPLSCGLPRLYDEKWKRLRGKLSPTFTSGKLKQMYPLLKEICDELIKVLDNILEESDIVEIKDIVSRFTIDCISSIAFGFNCNSLQNPEHEFRKYGKISNDFGKIFVLLSFYVPDLLHFYPVPEKRRKVEKFFIDLFKRMVTYRKEENIVRNDFLNMLMQLMDHGKVEEDNDPDPSNQGMNSSKKISDVDKISMIEAVAQSVIFFAAGQETTSSAICCCLYELALHQDVQEKLHKEIDQVFRDSQGFTFEKLSEMKYLDMVFSETLRKHPGAPVLNRICVEDFDIPESTIRVPKDMRLAIPINGLHADPDIYPEPKKFDPTRFSPENKAKRHAFSYIPFGEGPRQCIGKRLGILKPKIALCRLLLNYKFSACDKTQSSISYTSNVFVQVPAEGVYLRIERRNAR